MDNIRNYSDLLRLCSNLIDRIDFTKEALTYISTQASNENNVELALSISNVKNYLDEAKREASRSLFELDLTNNNSQETTLK